MSKTKYNYYRSTSPLVDSGFGYAVVHAPPHKALCLTQLSVYNLTNTAGAEVVFAIIANGMKADGVGGAGTYNMAAIEFFGLGQVQAALTGSTQMQPLTYIGFPTKGPGGTGGVIHLPPGSILVGYPSASANLNGTIQYTAIGYEMDG